MNFIELTAFFQFDFMTIVDSVFTSRQDFSSAYSAFSIFNCLFIGCRTTHLGGGLYISSTTTRFCINSTSFYNCSTSSALNSGGAGYIISKSVTFYRICCNSCWTFDGGSSFRINQAINVNISYYSYTYCSPSIFNCAQESFLVRCSTLKMVNANSSKNFAAQSSSGMAIVPSESSATVSYMNIDSCIKNANNFAILTSYYG